jgi:uncharacterized phiE125 gp8 family phage protein
MRNYHYYLKQVTPPAVEPLLVGGEPPLDVTIHVRPPGAEAPDARETAYLRNLISTARRTAENATAQFFIEQTWDLVFIAGFPYCQQCVLSPNEIRIPRTPLKATGGIVHVKYSDMAGVQQTLTAGTDYVAAVRGDMAIVVPAYGKSWPATRAWIDASGNYPVEVRFIAGYGTDGLAVPENFRQAMLLLIAHWYENREEVSDARLATVPMAAEALLSQDRFFPW